MKFIKNIVLFFSLFVSYSITAQTWEQMASLPSSPRHHPVTFSIDGFGYLVTGSNDDEEFFRYDPVSDNWEELDDFPGQGRGFSYGVTYAGKGYLAFGAGDGSYYDDLWEYDPNTEQWTELASLPGVGRAHPALIAGSGKIWMGLGSGPNGNLDDWWEYDIETDSWAQRTDFPGDARHHPYFFEIDGQPYVGFGHGADIYRDFYRFDFENNDWIMLDAFPEEGRVAGTQFSYEGKGYILSGQGEDHDDLDTGEFWEYDPLTDSWEEMIAHPGGSRWAPGSFVLEGYVYILCGNTGPNDLNSMLRGDLPLPPVVVNTPIADGQMSIVPALASDYIQLQTELEIPVETKVSIIDAQGKILMTEMYEYGRLYDVSNLTTGVYFFQVFNGNDNKALRFVKQ